MQIEKIVPSKELLDNIRTTKSKLQSYVLGKKELETYKKKSLFNWKQILLWLIVLGAFASAYESIGFEANGVVAIIFTIVYFIVASRLNTFFHNKLIQLKKDRIDFLVKQQKDCLDYFKNGTVVPEDYIQENVLYKLESYVINKRADSIKEAINLFENEERHLEQMNELRINQELQELTYWKIDEISKKLN